MLAILDRPACSQRVQKSSQRLLALDQRRLAQILAIQVQQVKTIKPGLASRLDRLLQGGEFRAFLRGGDRFSIDQGRVAIQLCKTVGNVRKFFGPVEARAREAGDALFADGDQQTVAVELGFIQPVVAGRCVGGEGCKLRLDEGGRFAGAFPLALSIGFSSAIAPALTFAAALLSDSCDMGFLFRLAGGDLSIERPVFTLVRFSVRMLSPSSPVSSSCSLISNQFSRFSPLRGFIRTSVQPPCMR